MKIPAVPVFAIAAILLGFYLLQQSPPSSPLPDCPPDTRPAVYIPAPEQFVPQYECWHGRVTGRYGECT